MTFFGAFNKKNHRTEIINTDDYLKGYECVAGEDTYSDPCFLELSEEEQTKILRLVNHKNSTNNHPKETQVFYKGHTYTFNWHGFNFWYPINSKYYDLPKKIQDIISKYVYRQWNPLSKEYLYA